MSKVFVGQEVQCAPCEGFGILGGSDCSKCEGLGYVLAGEEGPVKGIKAALAQQLADKVMQSLKKAGITQVEHSDTADAGEFFSVVLPNTVIAQFWLETPESFRKSVDFYDPDDEVGTAPPFESADISGEGFQQQLESLLAVLTEVGSRVAEPLEAASVKAAKVTADYGIGFHDPSSVDKYFGKRAKDAAWSVQNDLDKMAKATLSINRLEPAEPGRPKRGWVAGTYKQNELDFPHSAFAFKFTATEEGVEFDDESVDFYPEYRKKLEAFITDQLFGDAAAKSEAARQAEISKDLKTAEAEGRRAAGGDGAAAGRGRAQRRAFGAGMRAAAPYTAKPEPAGQSYKKASKFLMENRERYEKNLDKLPKIEAGLKADKSPAQLCSMSNKPAVGLETTRVPAPDDLKAEFPEGVLRIICSRCGAVLKKRRGGFGPHGQIPVHNRLKAAAPYTAKNEPAGKSYAKSSKFLPREGLYPGKARNPEPPHPTDLTQPGAKKMDVSRARRVRAGYVKRMLENRAEREGKTFKEVLAEFWGKQKITADQPGDYEITFNPGPGEDEGLACAACNKEFKPGDKVFVKDAPGTPMGLVWYCSDECWKSTPAGQDPERKVRAAVSSSGKVHHPLPEGRGTYQGKTVTILSTGPLERLIDSFPEAAERLMDAWGTDFDAEAELQKPYVAAWIGENPTFPTLLPASETTYRDPNARVDAAVTRVSDLDRSGLDELGERVTRQHDRHPRKRDRAQLETLENKIVDRADELDELKATQDITVSFKPFHNAQGGQDDVVQATVKPATNMDDAMAKAGFEKVSEGVYDRPGTDVKEAIQAFEGAVAMSGFDIAEKGENALVVVEKELVMAAKMSKDGQSYMSKKIKKLMAEGYDQKQAVAIAYSYARKKGFEGTEKVEGGMFDKVQGEVDPAVYEKVGGSPDQPLPKVAWPGGYPIFYMDYDGAPICASCANERDWSNAHILAADVNYEDPDLRCEHCMSKIESAYADDIEVSEADMAQMAERGAAPKGPKTSDIDVKLEGQKLKADVDPETEQLGTIDNGFVLWKTPAAGGPGTPDAYWLSDSEGHELVSFPTENEAREYAKTNKVEASQKVHAKELQLWKEQKDYAGPDFFDYYYGLGQTRDSAVLERANFAAMLAALGGEHSSPEWEKSHPEEVKEGNQEVMVFRAGHWAVGWVETILVHKDSAQVPKLQELFDAYEDYPVIDDDLFNQYESEQQELDWESYGIDMVMDGVATVEGFADKEWAELEPAIQTAVKQAFEEAWGNSGGDIASDDLQKEVVEAVQAWVNAAGSRSVEELEKAGQQRLPGVLPKEKKKKTRAAQVARLRLKVQAIPASTAEETAAQQRQMQVSIPAAETDKLKKVQDYLVGQDQAYEASEGTDPVVLTTTFIPAEGEMKDPEEEEFLTLLRSLGLKGTYVRGSKKAVVRVQGLSTDALTYAAVFNAAVMSTEPQGNELEASLFLSAASGAGAKLTFKQGERGLHVEASGRRMPILKTTSPAALVAWATRKKGDRP